MDMKIYDEAGQWLTNPCAFAFTDPTTQNRFVPGVVYRVNVPEGSWLAGQVKEGVFKLQDLEQPEDPVKAAEELKAESERIALENEAQAAKDREEAEVAAKAKAEEQASQAGGGLRGRR